MKHQIFYVQSGIAYALSLKIIAQEDIPAKQVIFLYGRGLFYKNKYIGYNIDFLEKKFSLNFFNGWMHMNKVFQFYQNLINEHQVQAFDFYTASISKIGLTYFLKSRKLQQKYFIEDGYSAYFTQKEHDAYLEQVGFPQFSKYTLKVYINTLFKVNIASAYQERFFKKFFDALYVANPNSFIRYDLPKRIVQRPFEHPHFQNDLKVEVLMAFSYPVEKGVISLEAYTKVLKKIVQHLVANNYKTVHYKFHPQQMNHQKNLEAYLSVYKEFSEAISFVELPKETVLESLFTHENLVLISDYSSLLIYAESMQIQYYSICNLLNEQNEKFNDFYHSLPQYTRALIAKNPFDI